MPFASRINAKLAIVSHPPYIERDGKRYVDRVEWLIINIFACHFRSVVLVRPRVIPGPQHRYWVALPNDIETREVRSHDNELDRLMMYAGIAPRRLKSLLCDADIVYGRLPGFEAYYAISLAKRLRLVNMASFHGDWAGSYRAEWSEGWKRYLAPLLSWRTKWIFNWVSRESDLLFMVGEDLRTCYAKDRDNAFTFANYLVTNKDICHRLDACEHDPVRVLFVGALSPRKGVSHLIEAVSMLRARGRNVVLNLVGQGSHKASYVEQVQRLNLGKFVTFRGYVDMGPDLWRYYENSDIFVLPTVGSEGCPKVVIEAMAKGCPVIATRVGSVPYMIKNGKNGLIIDCGRPNEIVSAIERLIDNSEERKAIIQEALIFAENNTYSMQIERVGQACRQFLLPRFGGIT